MLKRPITAVLVAIVMAAPVAAETFEIKMLNKGEEGAMVFEPAFVAAMPGDEITFVSVDKGHNAETIKGMIPEGAETFKSAISKDFSITLDVEGLYGIKCTPHFALGMVALIQVGEAVNLKDAQGAKLRGKAKTRFEPLFSQVQ
jgi:pseudoazurin